MPRHCAAKKPFGPPPGQEVVSKQPCLLGPSELPNPDSTKGNGGPMFVQKHLGSIFNSWLLESTPSNNNNPPCVSAVFADTCLYSTVSHTPAIYLIETKKSFLSLLTAKKVKLHFVKIQPNVKP